MRAAHAGLTLFLGLTIAALWVAAFWRDPRRAPAAIIAAPALVAVLGLGHWVAYDFAIGQHWASDFSLIQAVANIAVAAALLARRNRAATRG